MDWLRTREHMAPDDIEVLLSDGDSIYLGTYHRDTDTFYDQNRFTLPTPKYWHSLPALPNMVASQMTEPNFEQLRGVSLPVDTNPSRE